MAGPKKGDFTREGNREYFYGQLDRLFPGMKQKYIRQFGAAYVCNSPNDEYLTTILKEECERYEIFHKSNAVFHICGNLNPKNVNFRFLKSDIICESVV
jgi:hypothetical protein